MTYKSLNTVIREIVTNNFIKEEHDAEEVKILANDEAEQTPADAVAAKYVKKNKCGCNKAEIQKKIIDNA